MILAGVVLERNSRIVMVSNKTRIKRVFLMYKYDIIFM